MNDTETKRDAMQEVRRITNPLIKNLDQGKNKKPRRVAMQEIELAAAVILLEVALTDQRASLHEKSIIASGLKALFGESDQAIAALMDQAKNLLSNMRGSASCADLLKEHLDVNSKRLIGKIIDDLIRVDGQIEGIEIYLRQRFRTILGLPDDTKAKQPVSA